MEKVQFQLEATLPELQDLHDKGLFTKLEINQITKRRTALETSLVRQKTRKEDYFAYAEYEINLERLRKVRWKRLGYEENPPPPSASTYSIPRRVLYILKRATVKFPSDLAVWLAYVEFAAREGMRKVVLKGLTNALQHHPQSPTIYLLLSYHHIHPNEPFPRGVIPSSSSLTLPLAPEPSASFSIDGTSSARTTLLLGLRTCPKSHALWTEYIKLELGWVEVLRRRWSALGLEGGDKTKTAEISLDGGEGSFGPDGEDARKAILAGQLVTQALRSALETIEANADGMVFRENLLAVLRVYPSPLRQIGLDLLHEDLSRVEQAGGKEGARAKLLNLTRRLYEQPYGSTSAGDLALEGIELVEELGRIGKEIRKTAKGRDNAWTDIAGSWLHQQARDVRISAEMRAFLFATLASICSPRYKPSAALLTLHIDLAPTFLTPEDMQRTLESHAAQYPDNAALQRRYLEVLSQNPLLLDKLLSACQAAAKGVVTREHYELEDVRAIWSIWAKHAPPEQFEQILALARKSAISADIFPSLLAHHLQASLSESDDDGPRAFNTLVTRFGPSSSFYVDAWPVVARQFGHSDMSSVYEQWRAACTNGKSRIQAAISWSDWLLRHRKAHEARRVVEIAKQSMDGSDVIELDARWARLLDDQAGDAGMGE